MTLEIISGISGQMWTLRHRADSCATTAVHSCIELTAVLPLLSTHRHRVLCRIAPGKRQILSLLENRLVIWYTVAEDFLATSASSISVGFTILTIFRHPLSLELKYGTKTEKQYVVGLFTAISCSDAQDTQTILL
jgi:hypothetical protein